RRLQAQPPQQPDELLLGRGQSQADDDEDEVLVGDVLLAADPVPDPDDVVAEEDLPLLSRQVGPGQDTLGIAVVRAQLLVVLRQRAQEIDNAWLGPGRLGLRMDATPEAPSKSNCHSPE